MRSRAEGGVASKLGDETRLMSMKGGTVLDSIKMLACMFGGCRKIGWGKRWDGERD